MSEQSDTMPWPEQPLRPTRFKRHLGYVYPALALLAGMQIDVFTPRADGPLTVAQLAAQLRTLVDIISSTPRVFLSGRCKARFAGNSGAIAKKCNAAAATQEQPNVEIILTRVLDVQARKLRPLMYARVAAGMATLADECFANTDESNAFLAAGRPGGRVIWVAPMALTRICGQQLSILPPRSAADSPRRALIFRACPILN